MKLLFVTRFFRRTALFGPVLFLAFGSLAAATVQVADRRQDAPVAADGFGAVLPGDIVFIHVGGPLFGKIATTSKGWVSHVGIIIGQRNGQWMVAESAVPFSRVTPLDAFVRRSVHGQFAIKRLRTGMTPAQVADLNAAVEPRLGKVYDFGFNLEATHSMFCSKFVYQVVTQTTGQHVGEVETFRTLLASNPAAPLWFWRVWFFGRVPWERKTVTPESQFESPLLTTVSERA